MKYIGEFTCSPELRFAPGGQLVIQTRRGIELGQHVALSCSACPQAVTPDRRRQWIDDCGKDSYIFDAGRVLREATAADLAEYSHIQSGALEKRAVCQRIAERHGLTLKVVECECLFGGERIIFYFVSEERVDFRGMVKDLAWEFRTRIEMRQVGARDEARLLADFETCGRECCCKLFLKTLRPVTMKMAKLQKATLDPTKVSGRCGRLKCCLRYEHFGYQDLDKQLPRQGIRIRTEEDEGVIIARQVITQLVQIRRDDGVVVTVPAEAIVEVGVPPRPVEERPARPAAERPARKPPRRPGTPLRDTIGQPGPSAEPESAGDQPGKGDQGQGDADGDDAGEATGGGESDERSSSRRRGRRSRRGGRRRSKRPGEGGDASQAGAGQAGSSDGGGEPASDAGGGDSSSEGGAVSEKGAGGRGRRR